MVENKSRKRNRPQINGSPVADATDESTKNEKPTKHRRRDALEGKGGDRGRAHKPSSSVDRIDVPLSELLPQQRIDMIADLSESILEDPSTAFASSRTENPTAGGADGDDGVGGADGQRYRKIQSKTIKLLQLADLSLNGHDTRAARLALLSLLAVFQDLVPSYRIRPPTDAERRVRVSKETKKLWDHEKGLLLAYQRYLRLLEKTWEQGKFGSGLESYNGKRQQQRGAPTTLAAAAMLSLCELLKTSFHFNFRSNLLTVIVRGCNQRACDEVRTGCCNALKTMFAKDVKGEAALEGVRLVAKLVATATKKPSAGGGGGGGGSYKGGVHPDVIATFLSLPLRVHDDEAQAAKLAAAAKSKQRKKDKRKYGSSEMDDIERDLQEGEAGVDKIELARNQSNALHAVTVSYFRVLKMVEKTAGSDVPVDGTSPDAGSGGSKQAATTAASELLPTALSGLAKFAHLINMDAVVDLLAVLKDLLRRSADDLPLDAGLNCVLCAFKTLRGPGREMPVDSKEYLIPLYNLLPRLGLQTLSSNGPGDSTDEGVEDGTIETALECLDHAFLKRRELSTARIAAFLKRIASTSLHCPPHASAPLLAMACQISARYASSAAVSSGLFESEEDACGAGAPGGGGTYVPEAEDPEHAGAMSTPAWELAAAAFHVHPRVAHHAKGMASRELLKLPAEAPGRIRADMKRDAAEGYVAHRVVLKRHPLDPTKFGAGGDSGDRKRRNRKQRQQVRFITPRKTRNLHLLPATSFSML